MKKAAQVILEKKKVDFKKLADLAGLAATPPLGWMARFRTRFIQMRVQEVLDSSGWRSKTGFSEEVREELRFWVERTDDLNGQLIRKSPNVTKFRLSDAGGHQEGATMFRKEMEVTIKWVSQKRKRGKVPHLES